MPGLEDSQARLNPVRGSDLVTSASPVVEPRAVAQLSEAFRSGFITADDILKRAGHLGKQKEKVELQLLNEAGSPEAAEARKLGTQAEASNAASVIARNSATTPLIPQAAALAQNEMERQAGITKYPAAQFFEQFAPQLGLQMPVTADGKPDYAKMATIGSQLAQWQTEKTLATEELKNIDTHASADGTALLPFTKQGVPVPVSRVKQLQERAKKPFQFIEPGTAVTSPSPGAAPAQPPAPVVAPNQPSQTLFGADAQSAADFAQKTAGLSPTDTQRVAQADAAAAVEARSAAPMKPVVPMAAEGAAPGAGPVEQTSTPAGTQIGDTGFSLGPPKAKDLQNKAPTEAQQRAELALARFAQTNDMLKSLKDSGYDPTSIGSWVEGMLPQILKTGDRKAYEAAVDAWSQGLLRLESGAAISRQEKNWYDRAFFPQVNDPPAVVMSKSQMRHDIERMVAEIAQAGAVVSPESAEQARRIYAQAGARMPGAAGAAGQTGTPGVAGVPGGAPTGKVISLSTGKKFQRGPDGQLYQVQ